MNRAKDSHFSVLGIGPEPKQHPCRTVLGRSSLFWLIEFDRAKTMVSGTNGSVVMLYGAQSGL